MAFYPFCVLWLPLLHLISFNYFKWVVIGYHAKPIGIAIDDVARLISLMWVITLLIGSIAFAMFVSAPLKRYQGCSPFVPAGVESTTVGAADNLWEMLGSDSDNSYSFSFISSRYLHGLIIVTTFTLIFHNRKYSIALEEYNQHKLMGQKAQIIELDKEVNSQVQT